MLSRHIATLARRQSLATAVSAASLLLLAATAAAAPALPTPAANIPIGPLPSACLHDGTGPVCLGAVVTALDAARAELGLGPYVLPGDFDSLSGSQQIFVLSNLDRIAYGLPPVAGLSPTLAAAARAGMVADTDPDPTSLLGALGTYAWTANWAGDWANAPYAYYEWMYDDGYDGSETSNIDCTSATAPGCWDHRRNVLSFAAAGSLSLGVSVGSDSRGDSSFATTLVWTPSLRWTSYSFTWAQAQALGAGEAHGGRAGQARGATHRLTRH